MQPEDTNITMPHRKNKMNFIKDWLKGSLMLLLMVLLGFFVCFCLSILAFLIHLFLPIVPLWLAVIISLMVVGGCIFAFGEHDRK